MGYRKLLAVVMTMFMILSFFPAVAGAANGDPVPNYVFVPNAGEASVSKVDVAADPAVEVARYYTAPRVGDEVDLLGNATPGVPNTIAPLSWRTSRIALDGDNNAYVLNVGSDASGLTGSVARIQADTSELSSTALTATPLPFGTEEAVQILPVGNSQEMPRAIVIDGEGYIWIGFYGSGRLIKYEYNPAGPSLDPVGEWTNSGIGFYEMKLAPDGTIFISSRQSTSVPARPGIAEGIYTFDGSDFTRETTWSPYALLIDPDGTVYATGYSNLLYIRDADAIPMWSSVVITGSSQNRGMAFDGLGKIWIASTTNHNAGTVVYSYVIATGLPGPTYTLTSGTTPVGLGLDEAGTMWSINRTDGSAAGFIEGFNPDTLAKVGAVQVGYRPYAYGDFVVPPAPPLYRFCGYKYLGNTNEGLAGWTIELYDDQDVKIAETMTDETGRYCFSDLLAGTYTVREVPKPGWEAIWPAGGEHTVVLPGGETPEGTILYGTQRNNAGHNGLYEIDLDAGTSVRLFDAGGSGNSPNGLGFDPINGRLYFMAVKETAPTHSELFFYDMDAGTASPANLHLENEVVVGASFFEGAYYYIPNLTADLHRVTLNPDGTVDQDTIVWADFNGENAAVYRFGDFAINREGILYASTNDTGGSTAEFFSLDLASGEYTLIADAADAGAALLLQVSFGSDGTLYGHNAGTGEFWPIDLATGTKGASLGFVASDLREQELFSDLASGTQPFDFRNVPNLECFDETAWAAQNEPGITRFIPAPGNWATYVQVSKAGLLRGEVYEFPLYAGQTHYVGDLVVQAADDHLWIKYAIDAEEYGFKEGYCGDWTGLTEFHLQVEDEFVGFNAVRTTVGKAKLPGSAIPGAFEYKGYFDEKMADSGWIDAGELTQSADDDIFIAAHAVVWWCGYMCDNGGDLMPSSFEAAGILGLLE